MQFYPDIKKVCDKAMEIIYERINFFVIRKLMAIIKSSKKPMEIDKNC